MQKQTGEPSYLLFCVSIKEICKKENNTIHITKCFLNIATHKAFVLTLLTNYIYYILGLYIFSGLISIVSISLTCTVNICLIHSKALWGPETKKLEDCWFQVYVIYKEAVQKLL